MPFYTFQCNACGEQFEVNCTIAEKDSGSIVCPKCGETLEFTFDDEDSE